MASTDVISIGVTTRSRKRAREAALLHLLPALQDPHDRKKFKAEYESPHELSQPLAITRSPVHAVSIQTDTASNNMTVSKNTHGLTLYQSAAPPPFSDDQQSTNNITIPLRNPIEVIDLTLDRHTPSTVAQNSNQPSVILSSNIRVTRSAARRAQLQAKLAQELTPKPDHPSDGASAASSTQPNASQQDTSPSPSPPSTSTAPSTPLDLVSSDASSTSTSPSAMEVTECALGDSAPSLNTTDNCQSCDSHVDNVKPTPEVHSNGGEIATGNTAQPRSIPSVEATFQEVSDTSDLVQKPALSGTVDFISPPLSGREVFSSHNPSSADAINIPGSDDHSKKLLTKTSPSSYLAPNPVRRAPRISTAKRDNARYILEATEKAALLAYRETKRQFPKWMSNPSRTFFKDSTYIPGGLPIRNAEDDNIRVQLNLKMDLGIDTPESTLISNDSFTLQPSNGGLVSSFPSPHIQLDPDLDPLPLLARASSSISLLNDPLGPDTNLSSLTFPNSFTSTPTAAAMHMRSTKRGLWYNYALSVQHTYQTPSTISCDYTGTDGSVSMSFGREFPAAQPIMDENMYDVVEKDPLDWTTPVPPYHHPLSGGHMDSASLPMESISTGDSSLGAINTYPGTDLLPSLDQSCMTTNNLLTEWPNMDCISTQPQREDGTSIPNKTLVELASP